MEVPLLTGCLASSVWQMLFSHSMLRWLASRGTCIMMIPLADAGILAINHVFMAENQACCLFHWLVNAMFLSNKFSNFRIIHSALSLSGSITAHGSARSSRLMQKSRPSKLSARGKQQTRLRNVKSYVDAVCSGSQYGGEAQVQGSRFEETSSQESEGGGGDRLTGDERAAAHSAQYCERPQAMSKPPSSSRSTPPSGTFIEKTRSTWPTNLYIRA